MCYTFQENLIVRNFLAFEGVCGLTRVFTRAHLVRVPVGRARLVVQFDAHERAFHCFCKACHRSGGRAKNHLTHGFV